MKLLLENWNKFLNEWDGVEDEPVLDDLATELTSEKRHIRDVDGEYMERAPVALEDFEVWLEENPEYGHPGDWDYVRAYAPAWAPDEEAAWWVKEK